MKYEKNTPSKKKKKAKAKANGLRNRYSSTARGVSAVGLDYIYRIHGQGAKH